MPCKRRPKPHPTLTPRAAQVTAVLGQLAGPDGSPNDSAVGEVEDSLCRLEDCALVMTRHADCLMHCADVTVRAEGGMGWETQAVPARVERRGRALPGALRRRNGEGGGRAGEEKSSCTGGARGGVDYGLEGARRKEGLRVLGAGSCSRHGM